MSCHALDGFNWFGIIMVSIMATIVIVALLHELAQPAKK